MKIIRILSIQYNSLALICGLLLFTFPSSAQKYFELEDHLFSEFNEIGVEERYKGKYANVNQCTPWHHLKCVYTTGKETYEDGRVGVRSKHWWHMSYIGQACQDKYGRKKAVVFEGIFVIPHYIGVAVGTQIGKLIYALKGPVKKR